MRPAKNLFLGVRQVRQLNIGHSPLWLARTVWHAICILPSVNNNSPVRGVYCKVQKVEAVLVGEIVDNLQRLCLVSLTHKFTKDTYIATDHLEFLK